MKLLEFFCYAALIGFLLTIFFGNPAPVLADVAPPEMPPGANPAPGEEQTQVQMLAETVILEVQPTPYPRADEYKDSTVEDYDAFAENYQQYLADSKLLLESQPAESYTPNLDLLDELFRSLKVK